MLYNILSSMIRKGKTEWLSGKIDVFYAVGRLSGEEYESLVSLLKGEGEGDDDW